MKIDRIPCPGCARLFADPAALAQHRRATHDNPAWAASKQPRQTAPLCPRCGMAPAVRAGKFGLRAECCGLWSWNLKPLVGRETHAARIMAHDTFDALWKNGTLSRGEGYRRLGLAMGLSIAECHIGQMTETQALRVVEIVRNGLLLKEAA